MKKILTISIAAYNVEKYLDETLNSLLCKHMEQLEVLVINDGSKDKTKLIAENYQNKYPNVFKLVDKQNGGYGSTINKGIELATGKYFKQLDGDDKFDTDNLDKLLEELSIIDVDIVYNPYYSWHDQKIEIVYCGIENKKNETTNIDDCLHDFRNDLVMHSLAYKTNLLKENNIKILENSFYTDSEYALYPFLYAKTMKVFDFPIYIYRIGNVGQSVSAVGMRKHYLDFDKVINSILDNTKEFKSINNDTDKYILYKIANIFCISISNLIFSLPWNYRSYKYIKKVDQNIKDKNNFLYASHKEHKTVNCFRKGKFIVYSLLHFYLKRKYKDVK